MRRSDEDGSVSNFKLLIILVILLQSGQVNSIMKKLVGDNPEKDFAVLNKEANAIEGDESSVDLSQKSSKRNSFVVVFNPQLAAEFVKCKGMNRLTFKERVFQMKGKLMLNVSDDDDTHRSASSQFDLNSKPKLQQPLRLLLT